MSIQTAICFGISLGCSAVVLNKLWTGSDNLDSAAAFTIVALVSFFIGSVG